MQVRYNNATFLELTKALKNSRIKNSYQFLIRKQNKHDRLNWNVLAMLLYELEHLKLFPFPNDGNNLH